MSPGVLAYLAGMMMMFAAERLLGGHDALQWSVRAGGLFLIGAAVAMRLRALTAAAGDGQRLGHRRALVLLLVGASSLLLYVLTTETVVRRLALADRDEEEWLDLFRCLWPMVFVVGTVPMLVVDHALRSSPVVVPVGRVHAAVTNGAAAALGLCLAFPANYVGRKTNERWDLAYFKTPTPGTATRAMVDALPEPVTVRIFMPPSSEVATELQAYFAELEGPNMKVEILDQAGAPKLARALSIRDNGTIAITQGDVAVLLEDAKAEPDAKVPEAIAEEPKTPKPVTRRVTVSPDFEKAKRTLKKLDREVQKAIIELSHGDRVAYFTSGHGELDWTGQDNPVRTIKAFRQRLGDLGFDTKTLGLREGFGEKVPDDATVVIVAGPVRPFLAAEVQSMRSYLARGGSLLLALGPKIQLPDMPPLADPLDDLLAEMGVRRGQGVLASEANIVVIRNSIEDRFNLVSNSFTSHGSTRNLAQMSRRDFLFVPASGFLEEIDAHDSEVTFTVRSVASAWNDVDADAQFDGEEGESKEVRSLVAAITGTSAQGGWHAVVTASGSSLVDLAQTFAGNDQFVVDSINWLSGTEELGGTTESEEDVKIEHTKEGQSSWFYGTVLGVPLLVMVAGAVRLRRRKGGAK